MTDRSDSTSPLGRRELLPYTATFGAAFMARQGLGCEVPDERPSARQLTAQREPAARRFDMKKSINLWAFSYPEKWSLKESRLHSCKHVHSESRLTPLSTG
jgi:hexulose-6-phosphate isomerase